MPSSADTARHDTSALCPVSIAFGVTFSQPYHKHNVAIYHTHIHTGLKVIIGTPTPPPSPSFYDPFSGTTWVSQCQKGTSGLYGASED